MLELSWGGDNKWDNCGQELLNSYRHPYNLFCYIYSIYSPHVAISYRGKNMRTKIGWKIFTKQIYLESLATVRKNKISIKNILLWSNREKNSASKHLNDNRFNHVKTSHIKSKSTVYWKSPCLSTVLVSHCCPCHKNHCYMAFYDWNASWHDMSPLVLKLLGRVVCIAVSYC